MGACFLVDVDVANMAKQEARSWCGSMGGYLAEPRTQAQMEFVIGLVAQHNLASPWLGVNAEVSEGSFVWDRHPVEEASSLEGSWFVTPNHADPNGLTSENCVLVHDTFHKLVDVPCSEKHLPACQYDLPGEFISHSFSQMRMDR